MIPKAKPRCRWRGRHIAWCRKYGKFCDPPSEYEYCLGYEPVERLHETLPFAKVSHNIRVLRNQIFSAGVQVPPEEYLIVYRGLSDRHHEQVIREGIRPSPGQDKVYTTVDFRQGVRFAWAHIKEEGGRPVVYRLRAPVTVFTGEVVYSTGPTGFLMSGPIHREYILDWVLIPENLDEVWKLVDHYEAEDIARKSQTTKLLEKIPKVYYSPTSMYNISVSPTMELKSQFGHELREMISEAESQKREIGAMLCQTVAGQPHLSRACYGRRETVTVTDCHDGLSPLGSFHVHLGGTDVFSVPDLELAIKKEQLSCLGYTKGEHPYLKCVMPKRYYELPYETRTSIGRSLDQARQDIERANQLFRSSPSNPEARELSQRAQTTLRQVESLLGSQEVPL